jgi:hypothetical protein
MAFKLGAKVNPSFNKSFSRAVKNMNNLTDSVKTTAGAYLTLQGAQKALDLTVGSAANLEGYRNTLNVVMKDHDKAAKKMVWATKFANSTPFDTAGVIGATVKLESYGMTAEKVLPSIGNMAAIMGKDLDQGVEALADAQRGELERLKEFGITKANILDHANKVLKYKNVVNNKGQIVDQEKFNIALYSLMDERYKNGMEIQSKTAKGLKSTIIGAGQLGFAKIAGISEAGEIVDGSLFDEVKKKATITVGVINKMSEAGTFEKIGGHLTKIIKYSGKVLSIGAKVVQWLNKIRLDAIKKVSEVIKNSQPQIERLRNALGGIGAVLMRVFSAALPYVEKFAVNFIPMGVQALITFGDALAGVYNFIADNWTTIEMILVGILSGLVAFKVITKVQKMVQGAMLAISAIGSAIPAILGAVMSPIGLVVLAVAAIGIAVYQVIKHWDVLKAWFTTFKDYIVALFTGAYDGILAIFSGIGAAFTGIFDGVLGVFKGYVNAWVMLFNFVIKSLNKIKIDIPDWVPEIGGKSFGVNIPEIPMLARGGITTGPTLAMIGEGREQEAVLPLSKLDKLLQSPKEKRKETAGINFTYAPNIQVSGGMSEGDIRTMLKEDYLEFRKMVLKILKDFKAEEKRLKFA